MCTGIAGGHTLETWTQAAAVTMIFVAVAPTRSANRPNEAADVDIRSNRARCPAGSI
jgi:hypothetical protein